MTNPLARLPSVDALLRTSGAKALIAAHGRQSVTDTIREAVNVYRQRQGGALEENPAGMTKTFVEEAGRLLANRARPHPIPVFNLTGTVLHTNLGRAILPQEAVDAMAVAATQPGALEFDLETGKRGDRERPVVDRILRLTGAEDATFVNNNAAAVLLVLNSLALRKEVPVSRGELIEIGGSFRMPDIMARAGAKLVEVGTTNRTHLADFETAIGKRTGAVMKVHPSNFRIEGFTKSVPASELAALARRHGIPFIEDLGSGALVDLAAYGLPAEKTPMQALREGADVVTFSGDKLMGGPQAGLIVGRAEAIARIKRNPLKRALRLDKVTLAGLDAVLALYENPDRLEEKLPTLRLLTRKVEDIRAQAHRLAAPVSRAVGDRWRVEIVDCDSEIGSGALPGAGAPSAGLAIAPATGKGAGKGARKLAALSSAFRHLPIPVIGRIKNDRLIFDLRCLEDDDRFLTQLTGLSASP